MQEMLKKLLIFTTLLPPLEAGAIILFAIEHGVKSFWPSNSEPEKRSAYIWEELEWLVIQALPQVLHHSHKGALAAGRFPYH